MRLVIQRVNRACVRIDNEVIGAIAAGLLVLAGVRDGDTEAEAQRLASKTAEMRILPDEEGRFNRSLLDTASSEGAQVLVVSQFTLYADLRRGRRPSFNQAASPEVAEPIIEAYAAVLESYGVRVERGRFGAHMDVELVNDGPVTIIVDTDELDRPRRG